MKNFRTYDIALDFYRCCQKRKIENAVIRDQFERASLSVLLNLSEGSGKITSKDRRRFYAIAMGSLSETQSLLKILKWQKEFDLPDRLGAHLYRLLQNPGGRF